MQEVVFHLQYSRWRSKNLLAIAAIFVWLGAVWNSAESQGNPNFFTESAPIWLEPVLQPMNLEFVKDLWLPNIFIYNLKTYKVNKCFLFIVDMFLFFLEQLLVIFFIYLMSGFNPINIFSHQIGKKLKKIFFMPYNILHVPRAFEV